MIELAACRFTGPVHFGSREGNLTRQKKLASSSVLFSGLVNAFRLLFGDEETGKFLASFREGKEPPLLLSSLFPMVEEPGREPVYFLPRPLDLDLTPYFKDVKEAKRVSFLPVEFLEEIARGGNLPKGELYQGFYFPPGRARGVFWEEERPRVALDSVTSSSAIYYITVTRFAPGVGLYFLFDTADEWRKKIKSALRLLADEGLGGERTYGMGGFSIEFRHSWNWANVDGSWLLLSGFSPAEEEKREIAETLAAWHWREEGGYIYSLGDTGFKKKRCLLLAEGSVLARRVVGKLVDVTPNGFNGHRVYRYGYAFLLPWREVKVCATHTL